MAVVTAHHHLQLQLQALPYLWFCISFFSLSQMASLQSLSLYSPIIASVSGTGRLAACSVHVTAFSTTSFTGESLKQRQYCCGGSNRHRQQHYVIIMSLGKTKIEFIQGTDELTIPDVKLTKSRDGTNGMAVFTFVQPSVFDSSRNVTEITGLYMTDQEGVLQTVNVSAKFVNGKPWGIEAKYIMKTPRDWDRFIRFMDRYSKDNGLQFISS